MTNAGHHRGRCPAELVPVSTGSIFIGDAQPRAGIVLQIKNIKSRNTLYGIFVSLIVLHHFVIATDTFHLHQGEKWFWRGWLTPAPYTHGMHGFV